MRLLALASLFAGLLAVAVPAQARKPLVGTVVDGDGKPIDGASVECVLAPDGPDLPPVDLTLPPDSGLVLVQTSRRAEPVIAEPEAPRPKRVRPPRVEIPAEPLQLVETGRKDPPPAA